VNESVREVLAEAVGELKDPRIGFVTVTGVKTAADLRQATVFVSVLGSERKRAQSLAAKPAEALRITKSLLKRHLGTAARERIAEEGREFARLLHEPAAREALTAFVEKRAPNPEKYK